jgi:hypothetical protein
VFYKQVIESKDFTYRLGGGEGIETDRQALEKISIGRGIGREMVRALGLEPRTNALKGRCSTN